MNSLPALSTCAFLERVLPSQGLYVLATPFPSKGFDHYIHKTIESLADGAAALDGAGKQAYFATAGFREERPRNDGMRRLDNVLCIRALATDLDVKNDPEHYASAPEAVRDLVLTCKQNGLPVPMFVASGRGVHAYWCFADDIPYSTAAPVARALKKALTSWGIKHDRSVTGNVAGLLRPHGTHWRKEGCRPVLVQNLTTPLDFEAFRQLLAPFGSLIAPVPDEGPDEWSVPKTYPPSHMDRIAAACPAIGRIFASSEGVQEPLWRVVLGLAKHCVEGAAWAHAWSQGDSRYSQAHTQAKLDIWQGGPPWCGTLEDQGASCDDCQHQGKIRSPIVLGYPETIENPVPVPDPTLPPAVDPETWKFKRHDELTQWWWKGELTQYGWFGDALRRSDSSSTTTTWPAVSDLWWYPYRIVRMPDGNCAIDICVRSARGKWTTSQIATTHLSDAKAFARELGKSTIFGTDKVMQQYAKDVLKTLATYADDLATIGSLGWTEDRDAFVLGDTVIDGRGEFPVLLGKSIPQEMRQLDTAGTAGGWIAAVDTLYNRPVPGQEPYQFAILAGFASVLSALMDTPLWHGIPIALTGESGLGKTSTAFVATSIYGNPANFRISANDQGTSLNGLIQWVASARNLPVIMDELHGMKAGDLPSLLYALSNGVPKRTLNADRTPRFEGLRWNTISFVTSNEHIMHELSKHPAAKAEATQVRVFEIMLPKGHTERVFAGIDAKALIDEICTRQYGTVGRMWVAAAVKYRKEISRWLGEQRSRYLAEDAEATKERFYYDLLATVMVAGMMAKKIGLVKFNLKAIERWATAHIQSLRGARGETLTPHDEQIAGLFAYISDRTVVTREFPRGLKPPTKAEHVDLRGIRAPAARYAIDTRVLVVTLQAVKEFCLAAQVDFREFKAKAESRQLVHPGAWVGTGGDNIYPFRGTDMPLASAQSRAMIFNLDALSGGIALPSNVVPLHSGGVA